LAGGWAVKSVPVVNLSWVYYLLGEVFGRCPRVSREY
jgi:hypothetical protein